MNFLPATVRIARRHHVFLIAFIIAIMSIGMTMVLSARPNPSTDPQPSPTLAPLKDIVQAINNHQWAQARALTSNHKLRDVLQDLERQEQAIERIEQFLSQLVIRWIVGPSALPRVAPLTLSFSPQTPLHTVRSGVSTEIDHALETATQNINERARVLALIVPTLERLNRGETLRVLIFFQNTTELRPTGGFWGSFALATLGLNERTITVENTYTLDAKADSDLVSLPRAPKPLEQYLGARQWYLRDRNWSPDFPTAAREALDAYRTLGQKEQIDVVVAVNSTVLERLVALTGEIPLADRTVTHKTVIDTLEQLVEIDYPRYGYTTFTRKRFLGELLSTIATTLARRSVGELLTLPHLMKELLDTQEIQLYSTDSSQQYFAQHHWDGGLPVVDGDGLMVVEANLASLKTNRLVDRRITYTIEELPTALEATTTLTLTNRGHFDWRTTRYRTYVRFYVPHGSRLISVEGSLRNERRLNPKELPSPVNITTEKGWTVFGVFTSVEPKETRELRIRYRLPPSMIRAHQGTRRYTLTIAKQSGVAPIPLTLSGQFATTIVRSSVPLNEQQGNWTLRDSLQKTKTVWIEMK